MWTCTKLWISCVISITCTTVCIVVALLNMNSSNKSMYELHNAVGEAPRQFTFDLLLPTLSYGNAHALTDHARHSTILRWLFHLRKWTELQLSKTIRIYSKCHSPRHHRKCHAMSRENDEDKIWIHKWRESVFVIEIEQILFASETVEWRRIANEREEKKLLFKSSTHNLLSDIYDAIKLHRCSLFRLHCQMAVRKSYFIYF